LEQAEAALATAQSNLNSAKASTNAAKANIATSQAAIGTINEQIEAAKISLRRATDDFNRYMNLIKEHSITQQQFEQAQAAKEAAEKQVAILESQKIKQVRKQMR
jgi:membrane fusion protein (multidrug efflux system)